MGKSTAERVRKRREALRRQGLRPVQIWALDTRAPGLIEECRRQSRLISDADRRAPELMALLDAAAADLVAPLDP